MAQTKKGTMRRDFNNNKDNYKDNGIYNLSLSIGMIRLQESIIISIIANMQRVPPTLWSNRLNKHI